jgi:hypothetical protein
MSEMEYEDTPEVRVPVVRAWPYRLYLDWFDAFWGPRRGYFFAWGFLFWLWGFFVLLKFVIFCAGVGVIAALAILALPWDLLTYRHRVQLAYRSELEDYARETFRHPRGEYPPEAAG